MDINTRENKMGTQPVGKLLINMALPIILSMLAVSLYGLVDSYFVAKLGETAFAAMTCAAMLQAIINGITNGTNVGVSALIARRLGEGNREGASSAAGHGLMLTLITGSVFALLGAFFTKNFLMWQTSDAEILAYGEAYLRPIMLCAVAITTQLTMQTILISTGNTKYSSMVQVTGVLLNVVLDPIFIFTLNMGIVGAAWATVLSAFLAACLGLYFNIVHNKEISINVKHFRPRWRTIRTIYATSAPSMLLIILYPITGMVANNSYGHFSAAAVAAWGAFMRCEDMFLLPILGINSAVIPIVAYNSGARKVERIKEVIKKGAICADIVSFVGFLVFLTWNQQMLAIFSATPEMLTVGRLMFPIISTNYILLGARIIMGGSLQALKQSRKFLLVTAVRQLVIIIPSLIIFSRLGNLLMMLCTYLFAEIFAFSLSLRFITRAVKEEEIFRSNANPVPQ